MLLVLVLVSLCFAEYCVDVSNLSSWGYVDSHTMILYRNKLPIAVVTVPYCFVNKYSRIIIAQDILNDYDKIFIDGEMYQIKIVRY